MPVNGRICRNDYSNQNHNQISNQLPHHLKAAEERAEMLSNEMDSLVVETDYIRRRNLRLLDERARMVRIYPIYTLYIPYITLTLDERARMVRIPNP